MIYVIDAFQLLQILKLKLDTAIGYLETNRHIIENQGLLGKIVLVKLNLQVRAGHLGISNVPSLCLQQKMAIFFPADSGAQLMREYSASLPRC